MPAPRRPEGCAAYVHGTAKHAVRLRTARPSITPDADLVNAQTGDMTRSPGDFTSAQSRSAATALQERIRAACVHGAGDSSTTIVRDGVPRQRLQQR
jgi:hypothetical protein